MTPRQTAADLLRGELANIPHHRAARAVRMAAAEVHAYAIREAARAAPWREPGETLKAAAARLEAAIAEVRANARATRDRLRAEWHAASTAGIAGRRPLSPAQHVRAGPVKVYLGTPAERLKRARRSAVISAFGSIAGGRRYGATVLLCAPGAPVGVTHEVANIYPYGGRHKHRAARHHDYTVTVPSRWRQTVGARGLAVLDGLMTLEATPLESPPDIEVFAATWCSIKRDGTPVIGRGYIARGAPSNWWRGYHSTTYEGAIAGLRRKLGTKAPAKAETAETLAKRFRRWLGYPVQVRHARETGACLPGIMAWCDRVGLPFEAGCAPLADVIAAYGREPMREARAAILHAVKEARTSQGRMKP